MHTITSEILVAYSQCPRKAFLLLCTDEKGVAHDYERVLGNRKNTNRTKFLSALRQQNRDLRPYNEFRLSTGGDVFIEATLKAEGLEAYCDALTKRKSESAAEIHTYEPTIVVGTYSVSNEQKWQLFFAGYVLGKIQGTFPMSGKIVGMRGQVHSLKLENGARVLRPVIGLLSTWATTSPSSPPPVILCKHCPSCQFRSLCQDKAEKDDDLSLLDRMTPKVIRQYHEKGIFTITQLSFRYKRRRNRKPKRKTVVLHKLELQALAIRTGKIYLQELPELHRHEVELFLDIEGIPDQDFHYLIGLMYCEGESRTYHFFWADKPEGEVRIWRQFIEKATEYPSAPIYHYGSYETKAIRQMAKKYHSDPEGLTKRLVNLNRYIYGKIYFPIRSNGLKELGRFIGARWTAPDASGLQTLAWRYLWEDTEESEHKQKLLTYNREDCTAVKLLIDELRQIRDTAESEPNIDFADQPKQHATDIGTEIHSQFKAILKFAHADYDKKKISFRQEGSKGSTEKRKRGAPKGHQGHSRIVPKAQDVIRLPLIELCPKCKGESLQPSGGMRQRTITDLVLTEDGYRRTHIRYEMPRGFCRSCHHYYCVEPVGNTESSSLDDGVLSAFGRGFQSWIVYQRLSLRLSYRGITQALEEQFSETISEATVTNIIRYFASYYCDTEKLLLRCILQSPFVHVDETKINIQGIDHYVWVFTDGDHVIFKITETREASIAHEILADYSGILITDFYSGYDSVKCRQQKCWVHLIRDLNDDLWKSPFDIEFELFVLEVKKLIVPILEMVDEEGLRKEHLGRFKERVDQFYKGVIDGREYHSDSTLKYQKRFKRNRLSLFTFLEHDSIPWNNNAAERALRYLTVQEKISGTFYKSLVQQYLLLLGIMQTCRFQDKSFLKFLLSGEKDIDKFPTTRPLGSAKAVVSSENVENNESNYLLAATFQTGFTEVNFEPNGRRF